MYIYLAHQMSGLTAQQLKDYYDPVIKIVQDFGYKPLVPISKVESKIEGEIQTHGYTDAAITDRAIHGRDRWMILKSDIVYMNLLGTTRLSVGCLKEMTIAYEHNKHLVIVMEDDNIHHHAFVHSEADVIFNNENDALEYLKNLIGGV
jgi:hypothetical protein